MRRLLCLLLVFSLIAALQIPRANSSIYPSASGTCAATTPCYFTNVVWIMMENTNQADLNGFTSGNSSYYNTLQQTYSSMSSFGYESISGSLPNYLASFAGFMVLGSSCDSSPPTCGTTSKPNIIDRLASSQLSWKGYFEGMPDPNVCSGGGQGDGGTKYITHHNPFTYFTDITGNSTRCAQVIQAGSYAGLPSCSNGNLAIPASTTVGSNLINDLNAAAPPNFSFYVPNNCDNGHDGKSLGDRIGNGNNYLKVLVAEILATTAFNSATLHPLIMITFDEGEDNSITEPLYAVALGPAARNNFVVSSTMNHYSILATLEKNWHMASLNVTGNDATANDMTGALQPISNCQAPDCGAGGAVLDSAVAVNSAIANQFGFPGQQEFLFAKNRYWLFYTAYQFNCEGYFNGDCLFYTSSSDDINWLPATGLNVTARDSQVSNVKGAYTAITDGSSVFYLRTNSTDTGKKNDLLVRVGTLPGSGGTITWQAEAVVATNSTAHETFYGLTLTESTTAGLFAGYADCTSLCTGSSSVSQTHVRNAVSPYTGWGSDATFLQENSGTAREILLAQTSGKIYLVDFTSSSGVMGYQYSGGFWSSQEGISHPPNDISTVCDGFNLFAEAIVSSGDNVYAFWPPSSDGGASVCFNSRLNGAWGLPVRFMSTNPCNNTVPFYSCLTVTYEPTTTNFDILVYNATGISLFRDTDFGRIGTAAAQVLKLANLPNTGTYDSTTNFIRSLPNPSLANSTTTLIPFWFTTKAASGAYNLIDPILDEPGGSPPPPPNNNPAPNPPAQQQQANNFAFNSTSFRLGATNVTLPYQLTQIQALILLAVFPVAIVLTSENSMKQIPIVLKLKRAKVDSLLTAALTTGFDYLFHLTLTQPMEVPFYFVAKLIVAYLVARSLVPRLGILLSAAAFTLSFDIYYAIGVLLLHVPGLSSSPTQIIEIAGFGSSCLGYSSCDLVTEGGLLLAWTVMHGLFFLAAAEIGKWRIPQPKEPIVLRPSDSSRRTSLI